MGDIAASWVLQVGIRADPRGYTDVCGQVRSHVAHDICDPVVAHGMEHVPDWMHRRMCQEGTFLWPDEDVGSSEWGCIS